MKLVRLILAITLSLTLILALCPAVSADEESDSVDLSATAGLTISDVSAYNIGYYSATISWETNGNATSQVFYDTESRASPGDYANSTAEEITPVNEHSVSLIGLSSSTTYHYRVQSVIPDTKFIVISEDYTFRTLTPPPPPPPPPAVGGGGGPAPTYYLDTDLFGIEESYRIRHDGELRQTIEAVSEDGMVTISIPKGTTALDKDGRRLRNLSVLVDETPPPPPEGVHIIGLAYDSEPKGATFDPPIPLTWSYDPDALAEGVAEEDLVLAYYDEDTGKWVECPCTCHPETHCITACVCHFTCFAIFGYEVIVPPVIAVIPAEFSVSDLTVSPTEVNIGERVSIRLIVANTGGELGSYKVTLKINGVVEVVKEVTVHAGFSKEVTFTTLKDIAGTYSVDVDGLIGSFRVKEKPVPPVVPVVPPPPRINWAIVGPIIAVAVFLAIFLPIRLRKRRRAG